MPHRSKLSISTNGILLNARTGNGPLARARAHRWNIGISLVIGLGAGATHADSPHPWQTFSFPLPIQRGLYMPVDGGTLGAMALGYTDDARRGFGGATFFFDSTGQPVVQAIDGQVHVNDNAALEQDGVIAWTDVIAYDMSDGPCRGCADHSRQQTRSADTSRFEWTGPRSGRLTVNGQSQDMVEAFSGPPLVAATDYSGAWLMVQRREFRPQDPPPGQPPARSHYEIVLSFDLVAIDLTFPLSDGQDIPAGARFYNVRCRDLNCDGWIKAYSLSTIPAKVTLWFDDRNLGGLLVGNPAGGSADPNAVWTNRSIRQIYGSSDRLVGRAGGSGDWLEESLMIRIGNDTLDGSYVRPSCLGLGEHNENPQPGECSTH